MHPPNTRSRLASTLVVNELEIYTMHNLWNRKYAKNKYGRANRQYRYGYYYLWHGYPRIKSETVHKRGRSTSISRRIHAIKIFSWEVQPFWHLLGKDRIDNMSTCFHMPRWCSMQSCTSKRESNKLLFSTLGQAPHQAKVDRMPKLVTHAKASPRPQLDTPQIHSSVTHAHDWQRVKALSNRSDGWCSYSCAFLVLVPLKNFTVDDMYGHECSLQHRYLTHLVSGSSTWQGESTGYRWVQAAPYERTPVKGESGAAETTDVRASSGSGQKGAHEANHDNRADRSKMRVFSRISRDSRRIINSVRCVA